MRSQEGLGGYTIGMQKNSEAWTREFVSSGKFKNWFHEEFAEVSGLDYAYIGSIKRGKRLVPQASICRPYAMDLDQ